MIAIRSEAGDAVPVFVSRTGRPLSWMQAFWIVRAAAKRVGVDKDVSLHWLRHAQTNISEEVNVYHLLTHTSGIGDDCEEEDGERYEDLWKTRLAACQEISGRVSV